MCKTSEIPHPAYTDASWWLEVFTTTVALRVRDITPRDLSVLMLCRAAGFPPRTAAQAVWGFIDA